MGYIHCCGALHKTKSYKLSPKADFVLCELDYLKRCPICNHTVVQLTRIDKNNQISTIRKTNDKANAFFEKLKKYILYEETTQKIPAHYGKFYLNYNEYGIIKRCYSNLSALKIGRYENKDLNNNVQSF